MKATLQLGSSTQRRRRYAFIFRTSPFLSLSRRERKKKGFLVMFRESDIEWIEKIYDIIWRHNLVQRLCQFVSACIYSRLNIAQFFFFFKSIMRCWSSSNE